MVYSVAVTTAGQMTIPKVIRDVLGITDRVAVEREGEKFVVRREKTLLEQMEELDAKYERTRTPEQKAAIKKYAGKTVREMREIFDNSPQEIARRKEEYGIPA